MMQQNRVNVIDDDQATVLNKYCSKFVLYTDSSMGNRLVGDYIKLLLQMWLLFYRLINVYIKKTSHSINF